ncbi:DUF2382 domain-containing protein [Kineococcus sp. SYSU DK006]|uniref:DUF2382 domain-containing protein n=1 Tax=Kineococcus sp. SYSU DK006 TaxID=3383127 RepID=UPI003D7DE59F
MSTPGQHARPDTAPEVVLSAEQLQVRSTRVPRETVRVRKEVVTELRTIEVPVRVERLVITHEPPAGTRAAGDDARGTATGTAPEARDLEVVLHEEVPEVSVRVRPTERVRVRVVSVEDVETVSAELSREEAVVEVEDLPRR